MSKVRPVQQLTPEQNKAVQKFLTAKPNWHETQVNFPPHVLPTNFFSFSLDPFPKLVHDVAWIWNQTNSKISVTPECGGELILQKLNARKRRGYPKAPSYKVWQYTFDQKEVPTKLYAIWCEKGADEITEQNSISTEKRLIHGGFSGESIVNIPSLQQVREFNQTEAQLKKRDRTTLPDSQSPPAKFRKSIQMTPPMVPTNLSGDSIHSLPIISHSSNQPPGLNSQPNQNQKMAPNCSNLNLLNSSPGANSQFSTFFSQQTPIIPAYRAPMPWQRQSITPPPPSFKPPSNLGHLPTVQTTSSYKFSPKSEH